MPDKPIHKLLLVEDDRDTAALICETLEDHFGEGCIKHCDSVEKGLAEEVGNYDLIITDVNLPDGTGLQILDAMLERRADIPVIIITAEGTLENAVRAIQRGASDFVVKAGDYIFAIPIIVEKSLAQWGIRRENQKLEQKLTLTLREVRSKNEQLELAVEQLEHMASTDPLTGLANRRALNEAIDRAFAEATRYGRDLSCIMIDLDRFKHLNDTLGHQTGDEMLRRCAKVLMANSRQSDVAGRFGGDEFVIVMPRTDVHTARLVAKRIYEEFQAAVTSMLGDKLTGELPSMSMGIASRHNSSPANCEQLIAQADHALYSAKNASETCMAVYPASSDITLKIRELG